MTECLVCKKPIKGKWDSQIALGVQTEELSDTPMNSFLMYDKHIACSPSRAQHIVHPKFPAVTDNREQYNKKFWDKYERNKYQKLYTTAWVHLQEQFNPKWQ
jgi:hypothetical protein